MNHKLSTGTPHLNPVPVKTPWLMTGIGPGSPVAEDGSTFILTITDYFTKWSEAVATTDKSAASVATALFKVQFIFLIVMSCFIHFYCVFSCLCAWDYPKSSSLTMGGSLTTA